MKELEEAKLKVLAMLENENQISPNSSWIEWVHEGSVPATTIAMKDQYSVVNALPSHCPICLNLNGCHFARNNMPDLPPHFGCHCSAISTPVPIAGTTAIAESNIRKFTEYLFSDNHLDSGKKALFVAWGYDIMDSEWLRAEFIKQAQEKYANGEYIIGKLDKRGQRIDINVTLMRSNGQEVSFKTGWMVYPKGIIQLATPYGGRI